MYVGNKKVIQKQVIIPGAGIHYKRFVVGHGMFKELGIVPLPEHSLSGMRVMPRRSALYGKGMGQAVGSHLEQYWGGKTTKRQDKAFGEALRAMSISGKGVQLL